jgi:hypothetical protein
MRRTERLARAAVGLVVVYCSFLVRDGLARAREQPSGETFPFFMWELFSTVPEPHQTDYGLRLVEIDGSAVDGVYFEESLLPSHQASAAQGVIGRMGADLEAGRTDDLEVARLLLETRYLYPLSTARYELVKREYDVGDRYDCSCFTSEIVLAEFSMTQS